MENPKAYIVRQTKRTYAIRCPFCKSQHLHRVHAASKRNVLRGCAEERWMSNREKYNMKIALMIYDDIRTYDIEYPHKEWKDSLHTNTYINTSPLSN